MMRLMTLMSSLLLLLVIAIPAIMGRGCSLRVGQGQSASVQGAVASDLPVNVWFPVEGKMRQISLEEYLVGVVAAEMPSTFETEALKAQFLVARTYTVRRMHMFGGSGCSALINADVCASPETGQAYISLDQLKAQIGTTTATRYWRRLEQAGDATRGLIITYKGGAIDALYHSSSGTATESAQEVWGQEVPYLQSVSDPYGQEAPNYQTEKVVPRAELTADLSGVVIPANTGGGSLVSIARVTPSGRVSQVRVGDTLMLATQFREKLGLRSTQFSLQWKDDALVVTTRGHGHGVGMSQYGANGMAKRGASYEAIITHYYPGVKVQPIFAE